MGENENPTTPLQPRFLNYRLITLYLLLFEKEESTRKKTKSKLLTGFAVVCTPVVLDISMFP